LASLDRQLGKSCGADGVIAALASEDDRGPSNGDKIADLRAEARSQQIG
jgi:hypothetical protein